MARTTLYRRWQSHEQLVVDAILATTPPLPETDTGSVRQDLVRIMDAEIAALRGELGRLVVALVAPMARYPELRRVFRQTFSLRRAEAMFAALERGMERGELRPDLDPRLFIESLVGMIFVRLFLAGGGLDEPDLAARHVDQLLAAAWVKPGRKT